MQHMQDMYNNKLRKEVDIIYPTLLNHQEPENPRLPTNFRESTVPYLEIMISLLLTLIN